MKVYDKAKMKPKNFARLDREARGDSLRLTILQHDHLAIRFAAT